MNPPEMPPDTAAFAPPKVIGDMYACAICNCHHHATEQHFDPVAYFAEDWDVDG